jgi:hypothetical protein
MTSSPSWNRPSHYDRWMLRFDIQHAYALVLPPFGELNDDSERVKRAMTRPPGTSNVILTPDSFARLPVYRGMAERCGGWSRRSPLVTTGSEEPDLIILDEVQDSPYFGGLSKTELQAVYDTDQVRRLHSVQGITDNRLGDTDIILLHWQHFVSHSVMPLITNVTLLDVGGPNCQIVQESRTFQPVSNMH